LYGDLKLYIPIAAILPRMVETVAAIKAIAKVFSMALINEWCIPPEKSEL
jgi:hypothetical protein